MASTTRTNRTIRTTRTIRMTRTTRTAKTTRTARTTRASRTARTARLTRSKKMPRGRELTAASDPISTKIGQNGRNSEHGTTRKSAWSQGACRRVKKKEVRL